MDKKELGIILREGEDQFTEFKESFDKEAKITAVAFANTKGGRIFIGINDKNEASGVEISKESLKEWINEISQSTEPTIIPEIDSFEINGKKIVIITVKESSLKPVAFKGICYIRIKNSNKKLSPKEITELHLQTIGESWDSHIINVELDVLDEKKIRDYIALANESGRRKIKENPMEVMNKLGLIKNNKPTLAVVLLFSKNLQKFVSQAKVHCGKFKFSKIEILDDSMIENNLIEQVDEVIDFIKKNIKIKFVIKDKPRREEKWEYPLDALREAVINAIVHRDYTLPSEIQIEVYDDRIEIWNPGELPQGIIIEDLYKKDHKSIPRNKLIAQIFYDIGFIEKYGSGTTRMLELCKKEGIFIEFREISNGFSVIFRKDIFNEDYLRNLGLNDRQIKAIYYLKEYEKLTSSEYAKLVNISKRTARYDLENLIKLKILIKKGESKKLTYYKLTAK